MSLDYQQDDVDQPYAELGLLPEEYARIRAVLGRRPTDPELAMYSVMWSEHCSYKSSKVHLRRFAEQAVRSDALLAGIGANAGVVDVGGGLAVTFKVESHNHPSYVEPYQGAATGVGGIVRDILAMGARPVAVMDALRFGPADGADTRRVASGVVAGVGGYGNCLGLPNIGGQTVFDPSYAGNPLVNALCVGVLPVDRVQRSEARGVGNAVVLLGALTGRDGIGGVSVLASATFDEPGGPAKRPSVQVGDPFTEKLLVECCLELYDRRLVAGIQDLGGAGLTCALSETAAEGRVGMRITLERVPLRDPTMSALEVLTSESQERMLAIVEPADVPEVLAVAERWGVPATVLGEVTGTGRLVVEWHGERVADVPPASLADEGPVYRRPLRRPADLDRLQADDADRLPRPTDLRAALLELLASPDGCSRRWITEQYDRYVLGNTVLAPPAGAGVLRLDERTGRGVALSLEGNARFARLDPYAGAQLALTEAARAVVATGAVPLAITDCLNFGSPEDPEVMWQFAETVRGLADGCAALGLPVTGGNVSFYNSTGGTAIHPTPVLGVLGVLDDVRHRVGSGLGRPSDVIYLLGQTRPEFGGSAWAWVAHRHLGGRPPVVDLPAEQRIWRAVQEAAARGLLTGARSLGQGGLAVAVARGCLETGWGARIALPDDPFVALFAESSGRVLVTVPPGRTEEFGRLLGAVPHLRLGTVGGEELAVDGVLGVPVEELLGAYEATLPALLG